MGVERGSPSRRGRELAIGSPSTSTLEVAVAADSAKGISEMALKDALRHFADWLGDGWETAPPTDLTGQQVCELLWPLNDIFRPRLSEIRALPYDPRWGAGADFAIDAAARASDLSTIADADLRALRVLYERHAQTLTATAVTPDELFTRVPRNLSEDQRRLAVMLIVLHSMELPWPPSGPSSDGTRPN